MRNIPEVYDHIGEVLQHFTSGGFGWVGRDELAIQYSKMFPKDLLKLVKNDVRPHIPGMMSHYIGDNEVSKRPSWAPEVVREKLGSEFTGNTNHED